MKSLLLTLGLIPLTLIAAEPDLRNQLRDALYAEEVERDPAKASEAYEKILADFDQQRPLAASALFRLAEVRRKQEKNDEAIALYQRLIREFSEFERESELSREHLTALGGEIPDAGDASPENEEIARLKQLKETAPDIFLSPETLKKAVASGNLPPIRFLLENGADPNAKGVLSQAASQGFFEVSKLLFEHGCKPDKIESAESIRGALNQKNLTLLNFLLDQGLSPNDPFMIGDDPWLPLNSTIHSGDLKTVALLIERGADVNAFDRSGHNSAEGTSLHIAVADGNLAAVRLLLDQKAKPSLPSPDGAVTPLHLAVRSAENQSLEIMKLLLENGADLNLRTTKDLVWWTDREQIQSATPLDVALRTHQPEKIKALLATGAKVTTDDLFMLVKNNQAELFALLLQHVPDFSPNDPKASQLLEAAAKSSMDVAPLIAKGAKPPADWLEAGFPSTQASILYLLQEAFLYPKLASDNKVWLIRSKWWNTGELRIPLADKSQNPELPSTAQALLDSKFADELNFFNNDKEPNNDELETRWTLWRKNGKGKLTAIELDLASTVELPDLKWGDIVEVRTLGHPLGKPGVASRSYRGKSNSTYWNLLRRISFPIQVTRGEEITEVTVRGDCLSYDPTKPIVPLLPAGFLSKQLYPDEYHQALSKPLAVIVHRDGWDPIRLSFNTKEWLTFPLQANDRIAVDAPLKGEGSQLSLRKKQIRLVVPGTHFSRYHEARHSLVLLPMLSEMITDSYAAWNPNRQAKISDFSADAPARFGEIAHGISTDTGFSPYILPHPDLAGIRIRRLQEDGSENIIIPQLAECIANITPESTREQLAKGDIRLQLGDIVELPLKESSEPWTGFSEQEARYFHRLLSGAFQLTDDKGAVSRKTINWQPAELLPSPCGPIPFQPETGTASTFAHALGVNYSYLKLRRNEETFDGIGSFGFFIRDGDQLSPSNQPQPLPRPRSRIVPPSN